MFKLKGNKMLSFNDGIKFAEGWISVKEHLPEVDKDDMWNSTHCFSKVVLTKNNELNFTNYKVQAYNEELNEWQTTDKVTHWRLIERY